MRSSARYRFFTKTYCSTQTRSSASLPSSSAPWCSTRWCPPSPWASRCVTCWTPCASPRLDALRKPPSHKMFGFGLVALEQFKPKLPELLTFCAHLVAISRRLLPRGPHHPARAGQDVRPVERRNRCRDGVKEQREVRLRERLRLSPAGLASRRAQPVSSRAAFAPGRSA